MVATPRALHDLQQAARMNFKEENRLSFYHEGKPLKLEAHNFAAIKDGDLIVGRVDKRSAFRHHNDEPMRSTFQADFVKHGCQPSRPFIPSQNSVFFEDGPVNPNHGLSCYSIDFANRDLSLSHRAARPVQEQAFSTHFLHHSGVPTSFQSNTTYGLNFIKHNTPREASKLKGSYVSSLTADSMGLRFNASTSYSEDFGRPKAFQAEPPPKASFTDNESTLTDAVLQSRFTGESSYKSSFIKHKLTPQPTAKPPSAEHHLGLPFESRTEYKQHYTDKKVLASQVLLRIES